tara:strand:- start:127 stop:549 length:423 start_codon:yes stop_codon:yes gene_type:complete
MNRRSFIKTAAVLPVAVPAATKAIESNTEEYKALPFYVECFRRHQKEWVFSEAPFIFQPDGKMWFDTLDKATDFVKDNARARSAEVYRDDLMYEIYYISPSDKCHIHVGHMWYNGDTGRNVYWRSREPGAFTNWAKVECS